MTRAVIWAAAGVAGALSVAGIVLMVLNWPRPLEAAEWGFPGFQGAAAVVVTVVGAVITLRRQDSPVGWLLLFAGLLGSIQFFGHQYAVYGLMTQPGAVPNPSVGTWIEEWIWLPLVAAMGVFTLLLFPTGRLLSPRWRLVGWAALASTAVGVVGSSLLSTVRVPGAVNPFVPGGAPPAADAAAAVGALAVLACLVLAAASLGIRFRRSSGIERQQLKWLALAAVVVAAFVTAYSVSIVVTGEAHNPLSAPVAASLLTVPVAIALAMLRYGLYEVDRLINRTVVYAIVSALLVASYAGSVLVLQAALTWLTNGETLAVATSTLFVAAIFQPARRRVQEAVDRRFNRLRYDAERTVRAFTGRLRDQLDLEELTRALVRTANHAIEPASVSVWLRPLSRTPPTGAARNDLRTPAWENIER